MKPKLILSILLTIAWAGPVLAQQYQQLTDVPTVYIETENGQNITSKEEYIMCTFTMVDGDNTLRLENTQIRGRGNSSWWNSDKKPYRVKFDKKQTLLGEDFAKAKSWTLLANHGDKTMIRNALTYQLGRFIGMKFCPAAKFIDLYLNGKYRGTYQISDQVQVHKKRVEVDEDNGWLLEVANENSREEPYITSTRYGIMYNIKNPDDELLTMDKRIAIGQWLEAFEKAVASDEYRDPEKGYRAYIDETDFINWYVGAELTGNIDALYSIYMYKEADEQKMHFGPLWDLDLGYDNSSEKSLLRQMEAYLGLWNRPFEKILQRLWLDPWFAKACNDRLNALVEAGLQQHPAGVVDAHLLQILVVGLPCLSFEPGAKIVLCKAHLCRGLLQVNGLSKVFLRPPQDAMQLLTAFIILWLGTAGGHLPRQDPQYVQQRPGPGKRLRIPADHLLHGSPVIFQQQVNVRTVSEEAVGLPGACGGKIGEAAHQAHARNLVNNQEAFLIRHPVPFLRVGVMAGTEAVGADPLHAFIIAFCDGIAEPASKDLRILMLAEALQINGLPVQQNTGSLNGYRPDAQRRVIAVHCFSVLHEPDGQRIEIGVPYLPEMRIRYLKRSALPFPGGNRRAFPVRQFNQDPLVSLRLNLIGDCSLPGFQAAYGAVVPDPSNGNLHQPDAPVDTGIIEKVKIALRPSGTVRFFPDRAAWNTGLIQFIVGQDRQTVPPRLQESARVHRHREETALMLSHRLSVDEYPAPVGNAAEPDIQLLIRPAFLNINVCLIPEIPAVVSLPGLGEHIREAGRNRHGNRIRQTLLRPFSLHSLSAGIKLEPPQSVEQLGPADLVIHGIKF